MSKACLETRFYFSQKKWMISFPDEPAAELYKQKTRLRPLEGEGATCVYMDLPRHATYIGTTSDAKGVVFAFSNERQAKEWLDSLPLAERIGNDVRLDLEWDAKGLSDKIAALPSVSEADRRAAQRRERRNYNVKSSGATPLDPRRYAADNEVQDRRRGDKKRGKDAKETETLVIEEKGIEEEVDEEKRSVRKDDEEKKTSTEGETGRKKKHKIIGVQLSLRRKKD